MSNVQRELTLIMPEMVGEHYELLKPLPLHVSPLGARTFSGIAHIAQRVPYLGRVIATVGYSLNSLFLVAEAVTAAGFASLFAVADYALGHKTARFKELSIKALGYSAHDIGLVATQCMLIYTGTFLEHRSTISLISSMVHFMSSAAVELLFGANEYEGLFEGVDDVEIALTRVLRTFMDGESVVDLLKALDHDFGEGASKEQLEVLLSTQSIMNFLLLYPQVNELIQELDVDRFFDVEYQKAWAEAAKAFVAYTYHPPAANSAGQDYIIETKDPQIKAYQERLVGYLKSAIIKIYRDDDLVKLLSSKALPEEQEAAIQEGKDVIQCCYPEVYVPLARYAQLIELQEEISCPKTVMEGKRLEELLETQQQLNALTENEKSLLAQKLLKPSHPVENKKIQDLANRIGELAGSLHQGSLINLDAIDPVLCTGVSVSLHTKAFNAAFEELKITR